LTNNGLKQLAPAATQNVIAFRFYFGWSPEKGLFLLNRQQEKVVNMFCSYNYHTITYFKHISVCFISWSYLLYCILSNCFEFLRAMVLKKDNLSNLFCRRFDENLIFLV
jgi:hypothetical protein